MIVARRWTSNSSAASQSVEITSSAGAYVLLDGNNSPNQTQIDVDVEDQGQV